VVLAVVIGAGFVATTLIGGDVLRASVRETVGTQLRGADIVITADAASTESEFEGVARSVDGVRDAESLAMVDGQAPAFPASAQERLRAIPGVGQVAELRTTPAEVAQEGERSAHQVTAVDPAAAAAIGRADGIFDALRPGVALVLGAHRQRARRANRRRAADREGQPDGDCNGPGRRPGRRRGDRDATGYQCARPEHAGHRRLGAVGGWRRRQAGDPRGSGILPSGREVDIQGGAADRIAYLELVGRLLLVVTGLLAAAILIALIGVGNTLSHSVLERTREFGTLRALGLTAGQLRGTLAIEGGLIALVGGAIGVALGIAYGWAGALVMFGSTWEVALAFPGERIALILLVALLSVLPARRAAAVSPVKALATV
jgi:putative ABC transport system permease protein